MDELVAQKQIFRQAVATLGSQGEKGGSSSVEEGLSRYDRDFRRSKVKRVSARLLLREL